MEIIKGKNSLWVRNGGEWRDLVIIEDKIFIDGDLWKK